MELYYKIKTFTEFGFPVIVFTAVILIIVGIYIYSCIDARKVRKIRKYMKENGYEYYLRDVASVGGKAWWAYRRDGFSIDTDDLYKMSFKEIKKKL